MEASSDVSRAKAQGHLRFFCSKLYKQAEQETYVLLAHIVGDVVHIAHEQPGDSSAGTLPNDVTEATALRREECGPYHHEIHRNPIPIYYNNARLCNCPPCNQPTNRPFLPIQHTLVDSARAQARNSVGTLIAGATWMAIIRVLRRPHARLTCAYPHRNLEPVETCVSYHPALRDVRCLRLRIRLTLGHLSA